MVKKAPLCSICFALGCAASAPEQAPWRWSWEQIHAAATQVRAGKDLTPPSWPGEGRAAVALSFDLDNESLALRNGDTSPALMAQGQYGSRAALPRVLELLGRHEISATFFIPAVVARLYPDAIRDIKAAGHEIGIHGWIHERNSELDEREERELMGRALEDITSLAGARPVGIRTPSWDFSPNTLPLIEEHELLYDSSLMADDRPYELVFEGRATGVVELPVEWILDDYPYFGMSRQSSVRPHIAPQDVLEIWTAEFEGAYRERTLFVLTMHPHIIGHRSRIIVLDELIRRIKSYPDVWFATHEQVARAAAEQL